jgi:hypothetical protein
MLDLAEDPNPLLTAGISSDPIDMGHLFIHV